MPRRTDPPLMNITPGAILGVMSVLLSPSLHAQSTLQADGTTDTYALIESVLGAGTASEVPDCSHPAFGPHITQNWDNQFGKYVFSFFIHVTPDDDRCLVFDRQRNEIKTFGPSPAYLKGFYGDTCTFRWYFKLDAGFQPSPGFCHIHQLKAGDGNDADMPIITITPRSASPERMELIYVAPTAYGGASTTLGTANLSGFKGQWVEAYERVYYATNGSYQLVLKRVSDGVVLLSRTNNNLNLWRGDATFNRPKWGIYRLTEGVTSSLRDEEVRFADFCLAKGNDVCPNVAPSLTTPPTNQLVQAGQNATFNAVAAGTGPLFYRWRFNRTNGIPFGTNATLTISNSQPADVGGYSVVVSNAFGAVTSAVVSLSLEAEGITTTNLLVSDHWLDGTRSNSALPTDSAWFASSAASLVAVTNSLLGAPDPGTGGTLNWWTYFTTNPASPVQLGISDTLRITLAFRADGVNVSNASRGLRFGLYDGSAGVRTLADGSFPNGVNHKGYLLDMNFGQRFGGTTMKFQERTNLSSATLINTTTATYAELSSGGPAAGSAGFSNGLPYTLQLLAKRNAGSLDLTAIFSSTNGGWSNIVFTGSDTSNFTTGFDSFVLRAATNGLTATNFTFTEFRVELLTTNNHPPVPGMHNTVTAQDTPITLPVSLLLAGDTDPDGDALFIPSVAGLSTNNGPVTLTEGNITYTPPAGYLGADRLSYTLTDARGASAEGFVSINVAARPFFTAVTPTNAFQPLTFSGASNTSYLVQATTNLIDPAWLTIGTNTTDGGGTGVFTDPAGLTLPCRFYRLLLP